MIFVTRFDDPVGAKKVSKVEKVLQSWKYFPLEISDTEALNATDHNHFTWRVIRIYKLHKFACRESEGGPLESCSVKFGAIYKL